MLFYTIPDPLMPHDCVLLFCDDVCQGSFQVRDVKDVISVIRERGPYVRSVENGR